MGESPSISYGPFRPVLLAAGPVLFASLILAPIPGLPLPSRQAAGVIAWMATWWIGEVVPLAVTALLPLILFPACGILPAAQVALPYANQYVFLMLGGFLLAEAMQRHRLHRRIALRIVATVGGGPRRLVLGFMVAAAFLSMWLSNTATAAMLYPIGMAMVSRVKERAFAPALMLGIAYACNIGGMGTLVGTFPNVVLSGMLPELVPGSSSPDFVTWMARGIPLVVLLVPAGWLLLTRQAFPLAPGGGNGGQAVRSALQALGPMTPAERRTALVFGLTALGWIGRGGMDLGAVRIPGWAELLGRSHEIHDSTVAIAAAVALFLIPAGDPKRRHRRLLGPAALDAIPWPILILFGGGFALASGFRTSGLDQVLGHGLARLGSSLPLVALLLIIAVSVSLLTEVNSNTATATALLPLTAAAASALALPAYPLLLTVTFSASCAFMLPTATPPNAIVFASGSMTLRQMAATGLRMNIIAALVIAALVWLSTS
ncbi:MAG: SLC13 family permease [Acidobacteriota bacterium]